MLQFYSWKKIKKPNYAFNLYSFFIIPDKICVYNYEGRLQNDFFGVFPKILHLIQNQLLLIQNQY